MRRKILPSCGGNVPAEQAAVCASADSAGRLTVISEKRTFVLSPREKVRIFIWQTKKNR